MIMKYYETTDYSFLLDENHFVYGYQEDSEALHIFIKSKPHKCRCPVCGMESDQRHNTYKRTFQDTPVHCKQTFLHANVYKYDCLNPECSCKVFMEDLPFAKASQIRTDALNTLILGVSMFLSNEGASKVLKLLGVQISNDTIQRLYDRIGFIDDPDVEEIDGRDGDTLKEWLRRHKRIRLVARDRASAYASAINEVLPECVQVADRFHLLQNLLEYLKEIFKEDMPSEIFIRDGKVLDHPPEKVLREKKPDERLLAGMNYDNSVPLDEQGDEILFDNKRRDLDSPQYKAHAESRKKNNS